MNDESTHGEQSNGKLTQKDLYEQGSKCCQQYSQLTMQVRTLAQHVMIGYAVGLGLFFANYEKMSAKYPGGVLIGAGIILIVFAVVLCLLNLHHSHAFRAIRDDCLVRLEIESELKLTGPWQAHKGERTVHSLSSQLAWYSPFVALGGIGLISFNLGIWLATDNIVIRLIILVLTLGVFGFLCYRWLRVPQLRSALKYLQEAHLILNKAETDGSKIEDRRPMLKKVRDSFANIVRRQRPDESPIKESIMAEIEKLHLYKSHKETQRSG